MPRCRPTGTSRRPVGTCCFLPTAMGFPRSRVGFICLSYLAKRGGVRMAFPQDVHWALQPDGPFLSFTSGPLQARIYSNSGHIELAGPDLAGAPLAVLIRVVPPAVQSNNNSVSIGGVISSSVLPDGLELKQHLGAATITARLT